MKSSESSIIRFLKSSGIFFIGSVLSKAISILLLPLYTSRIPVEDMGYYDISLTYITIATSFLFFDVWIAILRYMYDYDSNEQKIESMKSGSVIFICSSFLYVILGSVFALVYNPEAIYLILLYGLSQNITNLLCFSIRGLQRNKEFAFSGIINTLVNVLFNLILILYCNIGYESLYISAILGFGVQSIYLFVKGNFIKIFNKNKVDFKLTIQMFKYSLPLCLNSVAYWVLVSLNRITLNAIYGNEANGIYAIGGKFSFVIGLITTCFTYAWQDLSFLKANEKNVGVFYSKASNVYSGVLIICTCILLPIIKLVFPILIGNSYSAAENTIPLFLVVSSVSAISTFIGNIFYAIKDTKAIFISMVVSAVVNLVLSYPLITLFYIDGANLSILLSFLINILIRNFILKRKIDFKLNPYVLLMSLPLGISIYIYLYLNRTLNGIYAILFMVIVILLYRRKIYTYIKKLINAKE